MESAYSLATKALAPSWVNSISNELDTAGALFDGIGYTARLFVGCDTLIKGSIVLQSEIFRMV